MIKHMLNRRIVETGSQVPATDRATSSRGRGDVCAVPGADPARVERGRAFLLDEDTAFQVAETFRALADSSRARIVYALLRQELCTCDLAAVLGHSESSVSQHLRVLRQLRLVRSRRQGKMVFYSLDDAHIRVLLSVALSHVRDADRAHTGMEKVLELFPDVTPPAR
jgi:DNA-binding transcriptional ArsR family regulator